jgi:toxin secretion/phage lysis holin
MKENLFTPVIGVIGAVVTYLFGGWSAALITLLIFMGVDYLTGILVAAVFKKSPKTETGTLNSNVGWRGLCKKGVTLMIVLIACQLDKFLGSTIIKDAVIITFVLNEAISIIENAGLMGVPIPGIITKAIEILKQKSEGENK